MTSFANTRGLQLFSTGVFGIALGMIAIGLVLTAANILFKNDSVAQAAIIVLNIGSTIVLSIWLSSIVYASAKLWLAGYSIRTLGGIFKSFNLFGTPALVIGILFVAIFTVVALANAQGPKPGSIEFTLTFVSALAQVLVSVILFAITTALGLFGVLLSFLILLIDAIAGIFGKNGIQAWLTKALAKALYDTDQLIHNMDDPNRIDIGFAGTSLSNPLEGYSIANGLLVTTVVTTTLDARTDADRVVNPRKSEDTTRFRYSLTQAGAVSGANDNRDNSWRILPDYRIYQPEVPPGQPSVPEYWSYIQDVQTVSNAQAVPFASVGTGVNISMTNQLYLNEYYRVAYEGCWRIVLRFCNLYTNEGGNPIPVGQYLTFDILPNTVASFVNFDSWNSAGAIRFPPQTDQDNDGLLSLADGGTDTDDARPDRDGDGLDDALEQRHGLNEASADTDGDGISDSDELKYYTNPLRADSDGDGLNDYTEVIAGWLVPYNDNGNTTRIWSDPNFADIDNDNLTDLEEFVFATNPWTATDPSIIRTLVTFDGVGVEESSAPLVYLPLDETTDRGFFSDASGNGLRFACTQTTSQVLGTCPTANQVGLYGAAADFDGSNDQLGLLGQTLKVGPELTLAAWVNPDTISNNGNHRIITVGNEKAVLRIENGQIHFYMTLNGTIQALRAPSSVSAGVAQHIAATYDGTTMQIYYNGSPVASQPASGSVDSSGSMLVSLSAEPFDGRMEGVALFDTALNQTGIRELMAGRFNASDLVVPPGEALNFSATVTNSHPTLNTAGQLVATSQYLDPAIPEPELVLNFEPQDYVVSVATSSGESGQMNCYGDGTCPSSVAGRFGNGIEFDGQNDRLTMPQLRAATIAFWLKVDTLPTGNERMYLFDTVSSEDGSPLDGDIDIWLDSSGYLWIDIEGDTPARLRTNCTSQGENGTGDTCRTTDSSWSQPHRSDHQFVPGADYVHVLWSESRLHIDSDLDSIYGASAGPNSGVQLGEGIFGNSFDGTRGLDGAVDELVFYRRGMSRAETNIDRIVRIFNGNYVVLNVQAASDSVPTAVYDFETYQNIGSNVVTSSFENRAGDSLVCLTAVTCPTPSSDGVIGESADFDGVDDTLPLTASFTDNKLDISLRIKPHSLPQSGQVYFLMESVDNGQEHAAIFYLNQQGRLMMTSFPNLDPATSGGVISPFDFGAALNQWTKIDISMEQKTVQGFPGFYVTVVINDDTLNATDNFWADRGNNGSFGPGRLGSRLNGTSSFDGQIDELRVTTQERANLPVVQHYDVPFSAPRVPGFGWLDGVTAGRSAFCDTIRNCPAQTTSGQYGDGIVFDGTDDYLIANAIELNNRSFTIAGWFERDGTNREDFIASQGVIQANRGLHIGFREDNRFTCAFYANDLNTTVAYTDTNWRHWACTYDADTNTRTIYRDGRPVAQDNPSSPYLGSGPLYIGRYQGSYARGLMDDFFVIPDALDAAGIAAVQAGAYPAITFPDPFVSFSTGPRSRIVVEGTARVEQQVVASQHSFNTA
ncbi:MAG: LamG-like jellyroll fold domain-containing protein, partial [Chloroflexota bacterium]